MCLSRILFFTCFFGLGLVASRAQTAQDIVAKHLAAMGGKERLQGINSLYLEGVAATANGATFTTKTWKVYDRLYRQEIISPVGRLIIIVTPRQGWISTPGTKLFKPMTDDQYRALAPEIDPVGPLVDYAAKGNKIELAGKDSVNGTACYAIKVYFPGGGAITYDIDAKTWYVLRTTHRGSGLMGSVFPGSGVAGDGGSAQPGAGMVTTDFGEYKIVPGGYIFPYSILYNLYGAKVSIGKIEVNGNVDADVLSRLK